MPTLNQLGAEYDVWSVCGSSDCISAYLHLKLKRVTNVQLLRPHIVANAAIRSSIVLHLRAQDGQRNSVETQSATEV
jgi:hypothetical protein